MPIRCTAIGCECGEPFAGFRELADHLAKTLAAGGNGSARKPKENKYRVAKPSERRFRAVTYRSKLEKRRAVQLYHARITGLAPVVIYEPMIRDLGCPEIAYRPDFLVYGLDDAGQMALWFEDVKGAEPKGWARTVRLWRAHGPAPLHILKRGPRGSWTSTIIPGGGAGG